MKTMMSLLIVLAVLFSCKKKGETKTEDPVTPTPTPINPIYTMFSSTIVVVDFTAPTNLVTNSYTANLSPTTTAMAYIVADSIRIDSLPLVITRTTDISPSVNSFPPDVCDSHIWNTYTQNTKEFKLKIGGKNELKIYEDGVLVSSRPIKIYSTYNQYDFSNGYNSTSPKTLGLPCADGKRFKVMQ